MNGGVISQHDWCENESRYSISVDISVGNRFMTEIWPYPAERISVAHINNHPLLSTDGIKQGICPVRKDCGKWSAQVI